MFDITGTGATGSPRDLLGDREDYCYEGYHTLYETEDFILHLCHCGRLGFMAWDRVEGGWLNSKYLGRW